MTQQGTHSARISSHTPTPHGNTLAAQLLACVERHPDMQQEVDALICWCPNPHEGVTMLLIGAALMMEATSGGQTPDVEQITSTCRDVATSMMGRSVDPQTAPQRPWNPEPQGRGSSVTVEALLGHPGLPALARATAQAASDPRHPVRDVYLSRQICAGMLLSMGEARDERNTHVVNSIRRLLDSHSASAQT